MLIFALFFLASAEWWSNSVVFDITENNFDESVGKSQHVILEFFAPYCHWCRMMFHEYEELSKHYNSDTSPWHRSDILIARVNAMHAQRIANQFRVFGFPTILFVPAHSKELKSIYQGPRTKSSFIDWIEDQVKDLGEQKFDVRIPETEHISHDVIEEVVEEAKGQHDEKEEHEEKFAQFEMVIEDVSSHASEKWRGEFKALNIRIDELVKSQQEGLQDVVIAVSQAKQSLSEQVLLLLKKIEANEGKIEEVGMSVVNRNNIENTQSRFNPTHMVIFLVLGVIIGFTISVYLVKIRPAKVFNKV